MANDGSNEVRIAMLEKQMTDARAMMAEMRKEYATKADLAEANARLARLESKVDSIALELKALQIECARRFAAIESQLPHFATREDVRKMGLRIMLANFTMHLAVVGMLLHYLK